MAHGRTKVPEIRKGDTVVVLSGKDAGKRGTVEQVMTNPAALQRMSPVPGTKRQPARSGYWKRASARPISVIVEGLNVAKKHTKARQRSQGGPSSMPTIDPGGVLDKTLPMDIGKVMLVCPKCGRPTRVAHQTLENKRRVRICRHCGEALEGQGK